MDHNVTKHVSTWSYYIAFSRLEPFLVPYKSYPHRQIRVECSVALLHICHTISTQMTVHTLMWAHSVKRSSPQQSQTNMSTKSFQMSGGNRTSIKLERGTFGTKIYTGKFWICTVVLVGNLLQKVTHFEPKWQAALHSCEPIMSKLLARLFEPML